jgi:K+-transporting ATPase A subunit
MRTPRHELCRAKQVISIGPVASQEAIKLIGDNGGGFFNANSAHPFENPSVWSTRARAFPQAPPLPAPALVRDTRFNP